ncbi:hypothetical protein ACFPAF_15560 [Hymenobacter endophyticus]|uniref:DUF3857 domain-containing protein n=1 Tax=Hymenobacter endophyticus TaxID=3076335 RepID=A0ABU3TKC0_9BACT|nr:hypothetical protein [Hymenobacter endophyticus]MDU0371819.1 hypothetical protein [Hymenobacter endophyticus]
MRRIVLCWLSLLLGLLPSLVQGQNMPGTILIEDNSFDKWCGTFNYRYEVTIRRNTFWLYRTWWEEGDKIRQRRKRLRQIPRQLVQELVNEVQTPYPTLQPADLGYGYSADLAQQLLKQCLTYRPAWNPSQTAVVEAAVVRPEYLLRAVNRAILRQGYTLLHSSGTTRFQLTLCYPDRRVRVLASRNYLGLPWRDDQNRLNYSVRIAPLLVRLLPAAQSSNYARFQPQNLVPRLARQLYDDQCQKQVEALTWENFRPEFNKLRQRFRVSRIRESISSNWQWNFENRLEFEARDTTMPAGVCLGVALTIQNGQLFPPDSVLRRADYYLQQLRQLPFLLEFLAADTTRKLTVSFNNTASVSTKISEEQRLPVYRPYAFLPGASADYLYRCVSFELTDEQDRTSRWVFTPEQGLILHWYNGNGAYRYTRQELDGPKATSGSTCCRLDQYGQLLPRY